MTEPKTPRRRSLAQGRRGCRRRDVGADGRRAPRASRPSASRAPGRPRTSSTSTRNDFAKKVNDMAGGRTEDRGAARRRGGAGVRPARSGVNKGTLDGGHGVLGYHYGKQNRAGAVGLGPGVRHGRQHAARLAQLRRRQGAAGRSSTSPSTWQRGVVPVRPDADAAAGLVQEADHQAARISRA